MTTIGFIGLGTMGGPMAGHVLDGTGQLVVSNRRREDANALVARGATWAGTAREVAEQADLVICMVPAIQHVREVCEGDDGLLAGTHRPTTLAVCSTVAADDVRTLDTDLSRASDGLLRVVDAPVSGGEVGAVAGTLSIMVGGDDELVAPALDVLRHTGNPVHLGPLGAGEVAKACNQMIVAATIASIAETSVVAERAGLDVAQLLELLQGGYAGSAVLKDKARRFAEKDYSPSGPLNFWVKDLLAYRAEAEATGTPAMLVTPILDAVQQLVDEGHGDADTAIIQQYVADRH